MSAAIRPLNTSPTHNGKSDVNVTRLQARARQAVLAEQIRCGWKQTLESVVQTGLWLIEGGFRKADFERYSLPFSYSRTRRLIRIARCPRILNPSNRALLPDSADALHEVALLSDSLFRLGVAEGVINSRCLVIDIKLFRRSFVEPGQCRRRRR
jgi:hypothetical protein